MKATICDVTIEVMPPEERTFPADCIRVSSESGRVWHATIGELSDFSNELEDVIDHARRMLRMENSRDGQ